MTDPDRIDPANLTPTAELILEVLAARWREGWSVWTFSARHRKTIEALAALGLVYEKSGVVERTWLAWLTDEGKAAVLQDGYTGPRQDDLWTRPDFVSPAVFGTETGPREPAA